MPTATPTFRVFVSSTFDDLRAERDVLQTSVFPHLRALCEKRGARFQAIDLRWGVRREAALDQQAMDICLSEIERCQRVGERPYDTPRIKPNFIVLLGDRYGWRPLPSRIPAAEFDPRPAAGDCYKLDENAVPPEYVLQPRTGIFTNPDIWGVVEQELHTRLEAAARRAHVSGRALSKYTDSATHQEISKGLGLSPADARHVFAFFRTGGHPDPNAEDPRDLARLKQDLRARLAGCVSEFNSSNLPHLCILVWRSLKKVILEEIAAFPPRLNREREAHDGYAERHCGITGRQGVLDAIGGHIHGASRVPLLLLGTSGMGKSAVMASASVAAESAEQVVVRRFAGITPDSSNELTLLSGICAEISDKYGASAETQRSLQMLTKEFRDRMKYATPERPLVLFIDGLDQVAPENPACPFSWLRGPFPENVSVILSATDSPPGLAGCCVLHLTPLTVSAADEVLRGWLKGSKRTLTQQQHSKVLVRFSRSGAPLYLRLAFEEARRWRSFDPLKTCILGDGIPGILDTLFNRLADPASHGPILVDRALGYLAAARHGLTEDEMRDVLSQDEAVHQEFEASKQHAVPERRSRRRSHRRARLPVVLWSRLHLDLEPYLTERAAPGGPVFTFYHRQLGEGAAARFLSGDSRAARHRLLADYFSRQGEWLQSNGQAGGRVVTELICHYIGASMLAELEHTLTDLRYISTKCALGLVLDLQADYRAGIAALPEAFGELEGQRQQAELARWTKEMIEYSEAWTRRREGLSSLNGPALPKLPETAEPWSEEHRANECRRIVRQPERLDRLRAFRSFVEQNLEPLSQFGAMPGFVTQQAFNHAPAGPIHLAARKSLVQSAPPMLRRRWREGAPFDPLPALLRTLVGHERRIHSVAVTPDGRRATSASDDETLRVWDLEAGACLWILSGHAGAVNSVAMTPDGRLAVSCGDDGTVRVWDLDGGVQLSLLEGHSGRVLDVSITPDGSLSASSGSDGTVRIWNLRSGELGPVLHGLMKPAGRVRMAADGRVAISVSVDGNLGVWDLEHNRFKSFEFDSGGGGPECVLTIAPDGRHALIEDFGKLQLWDLKTGKHREVGDSSGSSTLSIDITPDGRRAVASLCDSTLRVLDLESPWRSIKIKDNSGPLRCAVITADGRRIVSGGDDATVRVWDAERGMQWTHEMLVSPNFCISSLAATPDDALVVSANLEGVSVWDVESDRCIRRTADYVQVSDFCLIRLAGCSKASLTGQIISVPGPVARRLGDGDCSVVWDGEDDSLFCICALPDSRRAVTGSLHGELRLWNLEDHSWTTVAPGHANAVNCICPTADSRRVITGSDDATICLWDLEASTRRVFAGHDGPVECVHISENGRLAASGGVDRTVRVWDLETGRCVHALEGHRWHVTAVRFTPDGKRVVSTSRDDTLRIWNLEKKSCEATLYVPSGVSTLALVASFNRVIVGTTSGEVIHFDVHGINLGFAAD